MVREALIIWSTFGNLEWSEKGAIKTLKNYIKGLYSKLNEHMIQWKKKDYIYLYQLQRHRERKHETEQ